MSKGFVWTDELVMEFHGWAEDEHPKRGVHSYSELIQEFKQSKERIEVRMPMLNEATAGFGNYQYSFHVKDAVPQGKFSLIKQAIEKCLNEESYQKKAEKVMQNINAAFMEKFNEPEQPPSGEFITKEECERREKEAFNAARRRTEISEHAFMPPSRILYNTFEDYKNNK